MKNLEDNISWYPFFQMAIEGTFLAPIWMKFCYEDLSMSWATILGIEAVCHFLSAVFETPSGAFADVVGRKRACMYGSVLLVLGSILCALSWNCVVWFLSDVIWMIGGTLISGADSALLYDSLDQLGRKKDFKMVQGKAHSWRFFSAIVFCSISGLVGMYSLRLCFVLQTALNLCALIAILRFEEPLSHNPKSECASIFQEHYKKLCLGYRSLLHREIFLLIPFVIGFAGFSHLAYTPYFQMCNLPTLWYGLAFAFFNLVAGIISYHINSLQNILGVKGLFTVMYASRFITWVLMIFFQPVFGFLFIGFEQISRALMHPITHQYIHDRVHSSYRATAISALAQFQHFSAAIILPVLGYVLNIYPLPIIILFMFFFALLTSIYSFFRIVRFIK